MKMLLARRLGYLEEFSINRLNKTGQENEAGYNEQL